MKATDVEQLIADLTPKTRSETAAMVAAEFKQGGLSESERRIAESIFRALVKDVEVEVREALSAEFNTCAGLPHDIALALAADEACVALPMLKRSEVLSDADLLEIIGGDSGTKQVAIAERRAVSAPVADALIGSGNEKAVAELVANEAADLNAPTLGRIMDRYRDNADLHAKALSRLMDEYERAAEHAHGPQHGADPADLDSSLRDRLRAAFRPMGVSQPRRSESNRSKLKKTDAPTILLHWTMVLTLILSLLTGLRIAADAEDSIWARAVSGVLLQGDVIQWHLWAALSLLCIAAAYVVFLLRARLTQRIALNRTVLKSLADAKGQNRWLSINIVLYWVAFGCIFVAGVTGILLYVAPGLVPHDTVTAVHQAIAWSIVAYVVLHIVAQTFMGGFRQLLKILNPQLAYGSAVVAGLIAAAGAAAAFYSLDWSAEKTLKVVWVTDVPTIDGRPDDDIWQRAGAVEIHTFRGANLPGGEVTVSVRALHDGEYFYGLFEWPDATRSLKHLPLVKTEDGWKVMQREFGIQDEDHYYEDKFGVMLANTAELAGAGTSHLGDRPLKDKPGPAGGRGLHYTTDGSIVDVWHWKSVRSGSEAMNQIDDNYFGPPMEPNPKKRRYTGGYTQDPKTGGGFKMNWEAYRDGIVRPLRMPKDPFYLDRFASVDPNPNVGDTESLWMPLDETVPYSEALDLYPIGTIMPSVLLEGPYQGDRGDVDAVARWHDGVWRMEVRRKLDTGSKYDIPLTPGRPVYMWVAVFDHAQTRHSQHLHPVKLTLE